MPTTNWYLSLHQVKWANDFSQVNAWLNDSGNFVSWGSPQSQTMWQPVINDGSVINSQ